MSEDICKYCHHPAHCGHSCLDETCDHCTECGCIKCQATAEKENIELGYN